ncbi:MAG: radical SAM protein [Euryarchaeota archaeon]|nr:radical SAM protein [Euryarchaeota archaeon]
MSLWKKRSDLKPGAYKYDGKGDFTGHRFHLRVDSEGKGVLLVDASKLLFLNGSAMEYVHCILQEKDEKGTIKYILSRFKKVKRAQAVADHGAVRAQLQGFVHGDMSVMDFMGSETPVIGEDAMPSPYRMDLALTYDCQNRCGHCYNEPGERKALTTEQWKQVIAKTWEQGIPHIVFTGGEPTLHPGLRELIIESEKYGQVTGLVTNGRSLARPGYLHDLVQVGLDHVQITLLSHRESLHDALVCSQGAWHETIAGIKAALAEDIYVSTNTTIMVSNVGDIEETMRFIASLGVKNIAFNGIIRSGGGKSAEGITFERLSAVLARLKAVAEETKARLIWYSPTPYCEYNPINEGLGIKQCTACSINMAVEPDGAVLPCQSYYTSLGNILTDPWNKIWNHELCKELRERKYLPQKCKDCALWDTCGGGCPLSIKEGEYTCLDRHSSM